MRQVVFGIILILAFCFAAFAQIDNNIPPIIDPDSFYKLSWKDEKAQLDSFFIELVNHKETEGLIVLEFDKKNPLNKRIGRLCRIVKHIDFRKFDRKRILFMISANADDEVTTFWRIDDDNQWRKRAEKNQTLVRAYEFEKKIKNLFPEN